MFELFFFFTRFHVPLDFQYKPGSGLIIMLIRSMHCACRKKTPSVLTQLLLVGHYIEDENEIAEVSLG